MSHEFQSDGRRVKSTGDEAAALQASQQASRGDEADEASVFFARPVKVHKNRMQTRAPLSDGPVKHVSMFRGAAQTRREEVQGAEEVQEDENTATELPLDQSVAEIVEDEELNTEDVHHIPQLRHAETIKSEQHINKKPQQAHHNTQEAEMKPSVSKPLSSLSEGKIRKEQESLQEASSVRVEPNHHQEGVTVS